MLKKKEQRQAGSPSYPIYCPITLCILQILNVIERPYFNLPFIFLGGRGRNVYDGVGFFISRLTTPPRVRLKKSKRNMEKRKSPIVVYRNLILAFLLAAFCLFAPSQVLAQNTKNPATDSMRPTVATPDGLKTDDFSVPNVKPTSIVKPVLNTATSSDITKPDIVGPLEPTVNGRLGLLVEPLKGNSKIRDISSQELFNPASNVKLLTALVAIKNYGVDYRFTTAVWTNGTFDQQTGTITGDLIISGRDPSFHYEQAILLAQDLNKLGIRTVSGNLIVPYGFTMNFDWSALRSGESLYDTLDSTRRPTAATQAWFQQRSAMGDEASLQSAPSVAVMGAVIVDSVPPNSRVILTHNSPKLIDVLKPMLCYSNNFMSERIGENLGGPSGVKRMLVEKYAISEGEISLVSTSGLGVNRVSPNAMMKALRALRDELAQRGYKLTDIMPVAGIDPGTLERRFTTPVSRGSLVAKTGTLGNTDGGVSSLVGEMMTAKGETLLFVIFNQRGSVARFRSYQESIVTFIQNEHGGPAPIIYVPQPWALRMSDTKSKSTNKLEYESDNNK